MSAPHAVLLVALTAVSAAAQVSVRRILTPAGTAESLSFSPGIVSGDLVYLSGALGIERGGQPDIKAQTRRTFARLRAVLAEAGMDLSHAVKSNVYLTDCRHYQAMNEVYGEHFGEVPPTRATVESDLAIPGALIEIGMIAVRPGVSKKAIVPEGWSKPTRPYSWGILAGDTLFISGMVSRDPARGELVLGDVAVQTKQVLENVRQVLAAAGMGVGDVVSSTVYLTDARDFRAMNETYRSFFPGEDPPARATVRTRLMNPALRVEIQCTAVRDRGRRVVVAKGGRRSSSPFSPSVVAGGRQFLAGMVGRGPEGFAPDVTAQTRATLRNLEATLKAAGLGFGDVLESVVYLSDVRHFAAMNAVYRERLPKAPPVRTTIGSQLMSPDALVEIMMIAGKR